MLTGIQTKGSANVGNLPVAANTPLENTTGAAGSGGYLAEDKDAKKSETAAKFGDVLQNIQARYGAKAEKPREIKKTLGKDDFLRIMITQMQHQDPTKPFDAQQMAQQMAQYASVEQLSNVNQNLAKMQQQTASQDRMAMTGMIGKTVTIDRERFPHVEGSNESLSFTLPKDASEVKVSIISDAGEPILEKDLGALKAGENNFAWDGLKSNTLQAKNGNYMFRIAAKDKKGQVVETNPETQGRIVGVSFQGAEPVFLIGDARHQERITMKNIVKVDDAGPSPFVQPGLPQGGSAMAVANGGPAAPAMSMPKQNFIAFQKGEGSSNLEAAQANPEIGEAIAAFQKRQAAESAAEDKQAEIQKTFNGAEPTPDKGGATKSSGFPNGLRDGEDTPAPQLANTGLLQQGNSPAAGQSPSDSMKKGGN